MTDPTPDEAAAPDLLDRLQKSLEPTPDQAAAKIDRFMTAFQGTPTAQAWRTIRAERDALRAELEQAREDAANAVVRQTMLKGMSVEDGAALLELDSPRELVIAWVWAAREMLGDAPNYTETEVEIPAGSASMEVKAAGEIERFVFTLQRKGKLTPHQARQRAEAERDEMRGREADLLRRCDERESREWISEHDRTWLPIDEIRAALAGSETPQEADRG